MLAKLWKKVLMFILIVACLFNVVVKLVNNLSLEKELLSSAQYIQDKQDAEKAKEAEDNKEVSSQEQEETTKQNNGNNNNESSTTKKQENVVIIK